MRFVALMTVTVIGVLAVNLGLVIAGWVGALLVFGLVFWTYRAVSRRFGESSPSPSARPFMPREVVWSAFALSCFLGSCVGGMAGYNPDGYMQPRPTGLPWELIWLGTGAGAIVGLGIVALLTFFNWLELRGRRPAAPDGRSTIPK